MRAGLNRALHELLADDDRVVLLGEDLHDPGGGAFRVTAGLSTAFPNRVLSTPISEAAIVGTAIGLALAGMRPIVEVMVGDFLMLAADQLLNQAVKLATDVGGVPLVVRTASGGGRGYGPTHSQSLEGIVSAIPGLTVVCPSHRHDPGLLLERAVHDWPFATVVFEHKLTYPLATGLSPFEEAPPTDSDPGARLFPTLVRRSATSDVTVVTYGGMLSTVEAVAEQLADEEIGVDIIVPSLLAPLPVDTLWPLLMKARRVVVVEEGHPAHGFGAELGAVLHERHHGGRFVRIGTPPIPIPAARTLEREVIPSEERILEAIVDALLDASVH